MMKDYIVTNTYIINPVSNYTVSGISMKSIGQLAPIIMVL